MNKYRVITNGDKFRVQKKTGWFTWLTAHQWTTPPLSSPREFLTKGVAEKWIAERKQNEKPWRLG